MLNRLMPFGQSSADYDVRLFSQAGTEESFRRAAYGIGHSTKDVETEHAVRLFGDAPRT